MVAASCRKVGSIFRQGRRLLLTMAPASGPTVAITSVRRIESTRVFRVTHFTRLLASDRWFMTLPTEQLVIVRLGDAVDERGELRCLAHMVSD